MSNDFVPREPIAAVIRLLLLLLLLAWFLPARVAVAQDWEEYDYENLEFRAIGLDLGSVWPARLEQTLAVGLRADLGFLGPHVRVQPSLAFWTSQLRQSEVDRLAFQFIQVCQRQVGALCPSSLDLGQVRMSNLMINADAHYLIETGYWPMPYVGGGLALHVVNAQGEFINDTFVEELLDALSPGINLIAGLTLPVGPAFEVYGEGRYALVSNVRHATVNIGGLWRISPTPLPGAMLFGRGTR